MKRLIGIILFVILTIQISFADSKGDTVYAILLLTVLAWKYYLFAAFIVLISKYGKGKILSFVVFILCGIGILYAYFNIGDYGFTLHEVDTVFFIVILPFFMIIFFEFIAYRKIKKQQGYDSNEQDL